MILKAALSVVAVAFPVAIAYAQLTESVPLLGLYLLCAAYASLRFKWEHQDS